MMKTKAMAAANDPFVEAAAQEALLSGGSAVAAVLAGYFTACGAYAGVLLSPVTVLVAGLGAGARAFDGRLRQPGRGTRRPRGFQADEVIPDVARLAAPTGVAAGLVAHAYDGNQTLGAILKPGIARAKSSGADTRAELLRRIRAAGAAALGEPSFVRPLLHIAGPSQGGLLGPADFAGLSELDRPATQRSIGSDVFVEAPWAEDALESAGLGYVVGAVDVRGLFAALCYRRVRDGFSVDELELEAPLAAVPVRRGVPRIAPGECLPAPAPVAIRLDEGGTPVELVAEPAAVRLDDASTASASIRIVRDPDQRRATAFGRSDG